MDKNIMGYTPLSMKSFSRTMNDLTFNDYFYRLMLLSKAKFKWKNLPNGIDEKWIEKYLFSHGYCMFYKDPNNGLMVTRCTPKGMNYYDEPIDLVPYGVGLEHTPYKNGVDAILIRNNDECIPTSNTIQMFAYRLAEVTRTIDVNINNMKMPYIIRCNPKTKLTLKQVINSRNDNEPVIFADKNLDTEDMQVLKTDAPIVFPQLQTYKMSVWNECLSFLGINNANTDKRERLVDDEVNANNAQISLSAEVALKSRELACEQINKMFGTNISVELRADIGDMVNEMESHFNIKEGEEIE